MRSQGTSALLCYCSTQQTEHSLSQHYWKLYWSTAKWVSLRECLGKVVNSSKTDWVKLLFCYGVHQCSESKCSKRYANKPLSLCVTLTFTTSTGCLPSRGYEACSGETGNGPKWQYKWDTATEQWLAGKTGECFRVSLNERWMRLCRAKQLLQLLSAPGPNSWAVTLTCSRWFIKLSLGSSLSSQWFISQTHSQRQM